MGDIDIIIHEWGISSTASARKRGTSLFDVGRQWHYLFINQLSRWCKIGRVSESDSLRKFLHTLFEYTVPTY